MLIPFFAFRIMVGCWLVMLALAWIGSYLIHMDQIGTSPGDRNMTSQQPTMMRKLKNGISTAGQFCAGCYPAQPLLREAVGS